MKNTISVAPARPVPIPQEKGRLLVKKYAAMYYPEDIVNRALRDYKKGKTVSLFGTITKLQLLGVRLMPVPMVMKVWMAQQKLQGRE